MLSLLFICSCIYSEEDNMERKTESVISKLLKIVLVTYGAITALGIVIWIILAVIIAIIFALL